MSGALIAIGVVLLALPAVFCVAVAWIHYPQGIIRAMKQKARKDKEGKP